ncbi:MAG TPA: alpha/beta hydrolase-fold protein [Verrucomicrobiae bacterium]|nr:alpha/beta hydrolase-fold protein [Verrucomicrobiae bacterium]
MFWKSALWRVIAIAIGGTSWHANGALEGTIQSVSFTGPQTGAPITFTIYLPAGYGAGSNRYPVVYHLHGLGGFHNSPQISTVPPSHEAAVAAGVIEPCIIVFPDGYQDSFWADSANSTKPAETNVRSEIIPYVDANYRTIASRGRRVIQGFSMGGFGAAKFAAKFPDTFCACVIYDGAMLTWTQIQQRHQQQAAEIFDNSATRFAQYSPWHWLTQNVSTLRTSLPIRQVVGVLTSENRNWRDTLLTQTISPAYVETGLPHNLGALLNAEGSNSWRFIASVFASAVPGRLELRIVGPNAVLQWPSGAGEHFDIEHRTALASANWQALATNWPASPGALTEYSHTNVLLLASTGFYRVRPAVPAPFTFNWTGTNFTYADAERSFSGIMLKPAGEGPFAAIIISHGAGGTAAGYSLTKARESSAWGAVCIGPTLTHAAGGETNSVNMGHCPENLARITACANVLASLPYVDINRFALFGHSMGAFATIGAAGSGLGPSIRAAAISAGGIIPDVAGTNQAAPTTSEASSVQTPFMMFHCDGDPIVPASRSQSLQQLLIANSVPNDRIIYPSNSIPNASNWHNIHNDPAVNTSILTNTRTWFRSHGVVP